jgi:hypothetical protein
VSSSREQQRFLIIISTTDESYFIINDTKETHMNVFNYKLSGCAIAVAALLSACGGGGTTPDTTPPTVSITDNVTDTATSAVTFTFTFSEAVTGFTTEDITVTNGTKGAFTMASNGLSATLIVTPPSSGTGNIEVSVATGTFTDAANNANTSSARTTQAFGTGIVNLITNGDFSNGATGWSGSATEVRTENGNSFFFANVQTAGQPFAVNLSYGGLNIPTAGVCYKLSFTASTSAERGTRRLIAGIGLRAEPWTNRTREVELTAAPQNFELPLIANFDSPDSRVIFDMGHDTGIVVIDNVVLNLDPTACQSPSSFSAITFDDNTKTYSFSGFGGADDSGLTTDPTNSSNKVGRATKSSTAEVWAGTNFYTGSNFSVGVIPLSNSRSSMTMRVYSPVANIPVRLKVEDAADREKSVETEATVTQANTWQTLTFNFANQAPGTPALNSATTYNKASVFFNFGTSGANGGGGTFYFDDLRMVD